MKVLVISVHPDDETLGCGGTLLKHIDRGDQVFWLILTEARQELGYSKEFITARVDQIRRVAVAYAFANTFTLGFPTARLHSVDFGELVSKISALLQELKPEVLYMVNRSDIHSDHQIAARAVMSAAKSFRNPFLQRILMYECLSETEIAAPLPENAFLATVFSDIGNYMQKKLEIMKIYESELQDAPFPRSIEVITALARYRGSTIMADYAEAFMLLRERF